MKSMKLIIEIMNEINICLTLNNNYLTYINNKYNI